MKFVVLVLTVLAGVVGTGLFAFGRRMSAIHERMRR